MPGADFVVFIGHDSSQEQNTKACVASIREHDPSVCIVLLKKKHLQDLELYWREFCGETTEFAFTRFLVPYLMGYQGQAVFCDSDFIWRCSPRELLLTVPEKQEWAVGCVQHMMPSECRLKTKMGGKPQTWYPRKNWASLMLFNCDHPDLRSLNPSSVSVCSANWLFSMHWTKRIFAIPGEYNYLVGYDNPLCCSEPKAIHYTNGTPMYPEEENCEYADLWKAALERGQGIDV